MFPLGLLPLILLLLSSVAPSSSSLAPRDDGDDPQRRESRRLRRESQHRHRKLQWADGDGGGDGIPDQFIVSLRAGVDADGFLAEHLPSSLSSQQQQQQQQPNATPSATPASDNDSSRSHTTTTTTIQEDRGGGGGPVVVLVRDLTPGELRALLDRGEVVAVEQDRRLRLDAAQAGAPWNLDRLDHPRDPRGAGGDGVYRYHYTGRGVDVYAIDSGAMLEHADFEGRAHCGFNAFADSEAGCADVKSHGTHVASVVGGATHGVAKEVNLIAVKVVGAVGGRSGTVGTAIQGLQYVVEQRTVAKPDTPAVANISLGAGYSQALNDAVERAVAAGVVVVTSAGNGSVDACTMSPQSAAGAITVGSIGPGNQRSAFSNFGACVDIFAPGERIAGASLDGAGGSTTKPGTSFASPHAAAAAALYLQQQPDRTPEQVWRQMQRDAAAGLMNDPGTDSPNLVLSLENLNSRLDDDDDDDGGPSSGDGAPDDDDVEDGSGSDGTDDNVEDGSGSDGTDDDDNEEDGSGSDGTDDGDDGSTCKFFFQPCSAHDECCWQCNAWFHLCFFF